MTRAERALQFTEYALATGAAALAVDVGVRILLNYLYPQQVSIGGEMTLKYVVEQSGQDIKKFIVAALESGKDILATHKVEVFPETWGNSNHEFGSSSFDLIQYVKGYTEDRVEGFGSAVLAIAAYTTSKVRGMKRNQSKNQNK